MPNRLANENSPYLLQHKDNPVDWYPWGVEALQKAKAEDKPIFLSIGYAACHWCHVMEHESFENPETAAIMNEHFVNIKVDREERPDIDGIYMAAVQAMTDQGGWPMSMFLTPEGEPFYGGTYFPPVRRYNMPAFAEILTGVVYAWQNDREKILESSQKMTEHLNQSQLTSQSNRAPLAKETLTESQNNLQRSYDWQKGGWGQAPKFPQPMSIHFLLQRAAGGNDNALKIATHALQAMAKGGMYDVVGGGFARYSVDDEWLVPHFEKMLYDNAQLAQVYLYAHLLTGEAVYRRICEETLDFVLRELRHEQGGFFSSLDADSEGEEGKFYVWGYSELEEILSGEDFEFLSASYDIRKSGNFEGQIILQRNTSNEQLAEKFELDINDVPLRLAALHEKLLKVREARIRPGTDDKVLTAWNAWMLTAFADAARYLQRDDYLKAAQENAGFLLSELFVDGRLLRSWREGHALHNAYLEDYASLILGLLTLYQADFIPEWFVEAEKLAKIMMEKFADSDGGFYDTSHDHETLLIRPKEYQDNATPSGNSLAANALLKMHSFTGESKYYDTAAAMLENIQPLAVRYPTAFGNWLCGLDFVLNDPVEIAIIGSISSADTQALLAVVNGQYLPYSVVAASAEKDNTLPPILQQRTMVEDQASAYVCRKFVCKQPVNLPEGLREQLGV